MTQEELTALAESKEGWYTFDNHDDLWLFKEGRADGLDALALFEGTELVLGLVDGSEWKFFRGVEKLLLVPRAFVTEEELF